MRVFGGGIPRAAGFTCWTVFVFWLAVRWTAILTLGRFFTVDVAIYSDHSVVRTGLYRLVRHPIGQGRRHSD